MKCANRTPGPEWSTFAGSVSKENVRIVLEYASLKDKPACACNIQNAYFKTPSSENHYVICGPEFGLDNVGKHAIIVRALYGDCR